MRKVALAAGAFAAMEPLTALVHRRVMHGSGWVLHASHHEPGRRLEANDAYPVIFAGLTMAAMALGSRVRPLRFLLPMGAGVTAYGAAYATVHDIVIHQRFGPAIERSRLREAHQRHHAEDGAPYGMLWPVG